MSWSVGLQVVVLWVGTNNHGHTPEQILGGIMAIVNVIHQKLPHAHTLVLVSYLSSFLSVTTLFHILKIIESFNLIHHTSLVNFHQWWMWCSWPLWLVQQRNGQQKNENKKSNKNRTVQRVKHISKTNIIQEPMGENSDQNKINS